MRADRAGPAALLLELEGVLVDTLAARRDALAHALAERGLALADDLLAHAADGRAPTVAAARAAELLAHERGAPPLDAIDVDLVALGAARAFADRAAPGMSLVPGARDALHALGHAVTLAVVTRAPARIAEDAIALAGLDAVVRVVVAAEHVAAPKPSPAGHLRALARLGRTRAVAPQRVVALEDGPDGIAAATAAGVLALGVCRGAPDARERGAWVASAGDLTYDALVELVVTRGVRDT